jgi:hypothetical protein
LGREAQRQRAREEEEGNIGRVERHVRVVGEAAASDGVGEDLDREGSVGRRQAMRADFQIY